MVSFDAAHRAVHYPEDRRFRIWVRPSILIGIAIAVLAVFVAAWIEFAVVGLPAIPQVAQSSPNNFAGPHGFPLWVRYCHFFNLFFVLMLIRSGLSILMDHPRLYLNDHCTPGSEWIRFTPIEVPRIACGQPKTTPAISRLSLATPGYSHTVGMARVWHFIHVTVSLLPAFSSSSCYSHRAVAADRTDFVARPVAGLEHLRTLRNLQFPPEPNGFYGYNALQQSPISPSFSSLGRWPFSQGSRCRPQ